MQKKNIDATCDNNVGDRFNGDCMLKWGDEEEATSHAREKKKMKIFCVFRFCRMEGAKEALMEIWERNLTSQRRRRLAGKSNLFFN